MPIATVSNEAERYELESLEGAWVELKPLSHGQMLKRREMGTSQSMELTGKKGKDMMNIDLIQRAAQVFEFKHCIVDHNLEELVLVKGINIDNEMKPQKMDFNDPSTIDKLDPKVGGELEKLIDGINKFEDGEADGSGN